MKKRIAFLLTLIILLIFVSGCWDYIEYEDLQQVVGIAVDFNNKTKESTATLQYLIPKSTQGPESSGTSLGKTGAVYSASAATFYDAISKLQQVSPKRIFYGYLKVFILGEEAATYNLKDQMELTDRTPVLRDTALCFVCSGQAEKVLSTADENTGETSSQTIAGLIKNAQATGAAFPDTIHDVSEMLAISGWEVTIPRVISTAEADGGLQSVGNLDNIRLDEKNTGGLQVAGMAAFKGDKFVGWLNEKETLGFGWITGKKMTAYKVSLSPTGTDPANILYFRIIQSGGKIKPDIVDNKPVISVDVNVEADLRKYYSNQGADILTPDEITTIEQELADSIRSDINAALQRGQTELQSDIFGFGFAFFRKYPGLWQTEYEKIWPDIYPDTTVNVDVKVHVINTGSNIRRLILK